MTIHVETKCNHKVTYDDYNPRIYFEETKCKKCGEWFASNEIEGDVCSDCVEEDDCGEDQ